MVLCNRIIILGKSYIVTSKLGILSTYFSNKNRPPKYKLKSSRRGTMYLLVNPDLYSKMLSVYESGARDIDPLPETIDQTSFRRIGIVFVFGLTKL
jgi:hypothetical protein